MIKENVQKRLKALKMSQNDLADSLGVSRQTLHYYFNGNITLSKLAEIARILGVQPYELIRPQEDTTTKPEHQENALICPYCGNKLGVTFYTLNGNQESE